MHVSRGFSMVEVLVGIAIFVVVLIGFFGAATSAYQAVSKAGDKIQGAFLLSEGVEAIKYLRDIDYSNNIRTQSILYDQCIRFSDTLQQFTTTQKDNVTWMHFDETASVVKDSSGKGHDGATTAVTYAQPGKYQTAFQFNGTNSVVSIPNSSDFTNLTSFTVSAWIKTSDVTGGFRSIVSQSVSVAGWNFYLNSNKLAFYSLNEGASILTAPASTPPLNNNQWRHVAVVRSVQGSTATISLYVDGVLAVSQSYASSGAYNLSYPINIGAAFAGFIDEVTLYRAALQLKDIQALASSNTPYCGTDLGEFTRSIQFQNVCREDATLTLLSGFTKDEILGPTTVANDGGACTGPNGTTGVVDVQTKYAKVNVFWGAQNKYKDSIELYLTNLFRTP